MSIEVAGFTFRSGKGKANMPLKRVLPPYRDFNKVWEAHWTATQSRQLGGQHDAPHIGITYQLVRHNVQPQIADRIRESMKLHTYMYKM